ncbi:MAG: ATP-dependent RNA helicase HrpA [Verrucomicrobia bacterium]|jgi:ATP-dependent helicase HrpA|nr:ATP-dependent RNA helicase HrpA [Verrucomicrobiota bacterium]OQC65748.1 MAG: ATP-dependent RNA helicase HrpB [Verrucomicrobia bacterium ADurb.Bin006]MDI9382326.1 ATP-dependent RNA helicase HrpA [Verrucomicrobiota bacterium]HOA60356.1 ATP-dependent RNA helicase HrpA [Verrucomicrobiota bacterium]HOF48160.1 ATP-dependent RNA helicase HrpA [Verrucomicrobiota bacterium]
MRAAASVNPVASLKELERLLPRCLLTDQLRIGWKVTRWLEAHRQSSRAPHDLPRWLDEARDSIARRARRQAALPELRYPHELPISAKRNEILDALRAHQVLIVAGETGSGKTTQLPKICLEAGFGVRAKIGCTQPRRVAALSLSRRVADEIDRPWGRAVGCKIRFSDQTSPETYVKFMTDGILLAEAQADPVLSEYEVVILDEAHERSLNIDFLIGLLKRLLSQRSDLKLLVTSATIDTEAFARHFDDAPIITVSGRLFPVTVEYRPFGAGSGDEDGDRTEDGRTYVDAAVDAVQEILATSASGDVLVFMPGERDIIETRDALREAGGGRLELVPLFGRLSTDEQQRVFAASERRKIVIATNIAETSLTVPGIRYVVDTGLGRISRYNARTRTRRLPIEPISQSSANQRKGRCGRVAEGVCYRLYSEEEFQARPLYTQPEIQRANLADVILRMKAFDLGEVEEFPFIHPPLPAAIAGAYQLLAEIGALDADRRLTPLGERLARLPVDPTIGRMILQAQIEGVLEPVLIISAGLSIQDPRERPADRQDAASAAHRRFQHPRSDFLTLVRIWEACHESLESLKTQSQMRKFCREHFLSFPRMREWRDIHAQLRETVAHMGGPPGPAAPDDADETLEDALTQGPHTLASNEPCPRPAVRDESAPSRSVKGRNQRHLTTPAAGFIAQSEQQQTAGRGADSWYAAVHRSILTGLFSHVAARKERNLYRLAGNREAMVFPGSGLFERGTERRVESGHKDAPKAPPRSQTQPAWIVAGEIVETSRRFVRTVAEIEPRWILDLAPHLIRKAHLDPHWDPTAGRVAALERVTLNGLVVSERMVSYRQSHPAEATEIFIRAALISEGLADHFRSATRVQDNAAQSLTARAGGAGQGRREQAALGQSRVDPPPPDLASLPSAYQFLRHNHQLRQKIELWQSRLQHRLVPDLDEALHRAYAKRLSNVGSVADLNHLLRERRAEGTSWLCLDAADLLGKHAGAFDGLAFPDAVAIGTQQVPVAYDYAPGDDRDGVTVRLPFTLAQVIEPHLLDWAVPGLREPQILHLLQALPKDLRRPLMPLAPRAKEMAQAIKPDGSAFLPALIRFIRERYGVEVPSTAWSVELLPAHLRPRFEILGRDNQPLACGRDLRALQVELESHDTTIESEAWRSAVARWERYGLKDWTCGDLPDRIQVADVAGFPIEAFPALHVEAGEVSLRLFRTAAAAIEAHAGGVRRLLEMGLQRELAWLAKDLRGLNQWRLLYITIGPVDELEATAFANLRRHLLTASAASPRTAAAFAALRESTRAAIRGLAPQLSDRLAEILRLRQAILLCRKPYPRMREDLDRLVPAGFLGQVPFDRLPHLARYLKAMLIRAERAAVNPAKDREKLDRVQPWIAALAAIRIAPDASDAVRGERDALRWLIEEYKVSVFAQELGTAGTVSPQTLEQRLAALRNRPASNTVRSR